MCAEVLQRLPVQRTLHSALVRVKPGSGRQELLVLGGRAHGEAQPMVPMVLDLEDGAYTWHLSTAYTACECGRGGSNIGSSSGGQASSSKSCGSSSSSGGKASVSNQGAGVAQPYLPPPRLRAGTWVVGDTWLVLLGGHDHRQGSQFLDDAQRLHLPSLCWRTPPRMVGSPPWLTARAAGLTAVSGVAFGGCISSIMGLMPVVRMDVLLPAAAGQVAHVPGVQPVTAAVAAEHPGGSQVAAPVETGASSYAPPASPGQSACQLLVELDMAALSSSPTVPLPESHAARSGASEAAAGGPSTTSHAHNTPLIAWPTGALASVASARRKQAQSQGHLPQDYQARSHSQLPSYIADGSTSAAASAQPLRAISSEGMASSAGFTARCMDTPNIVLSPRIPLLSRGGHHDGPWLLNGSFSLTGFPGNGPASAPAAAPAGTTQLVLGTSTPVVLTAPNTHNVHQSPSTSSPSVGARVGLMGVSVGVGANAAGSGLLSASACLQQCYRDVTSTTETAKEVVSQSAQGAEFVGVKGSSKGCGDDGHEAHEAQGSGPLSEAVSRCRGSCHTNDSSGSSGGDSYGSSSTGAVTHGQRLAAGQEAEQGPASRASQAPQAQPLPHAQDQAQPALMGVWLLLAGVVLVVALVMADWVRSHATTSLGGLLHGAPSVVLMLAVGAMLRRAARQPA